jgi:hypothetical protein
MQEISAVLSEVFQELSHARANYPAMIDRYDGWAVIAEEIDELWELVKIKQSRHDYASMRFECIQIAAMCMRYKLDCCNVPSDHIRDCVSEQVECISKVQTAHQGYARIFEAFPVSANSIGDMYRVAAHAIRFILDVCQ